MTNHLFKTVSLLVLLTAPGLAKAQPSNPSNGAQLEELVVTAERREANIQDVPIAVSAVTGERLRESGARDVRDLQQFVPNLQFNPVSSATAATIFIRGVGVSDFNANTTGAVGVYVDDVFLAASSAKLFSVFDPAGVEVLRGPQGTLYGRNTTGGAIKFISKGPTEVPSGDVEVNYGNFNYLRLDGGLGGPLVADKLTARISGFRETRDGYLTNLVTGHKLNNIDVWAARAMFEFTPTESFSALLSIHGGKNAGDSRNFGFRGQLPGNSDLSGYAPTDTNIDHQSYNVEGKELVESFGASLKLEQEFSWGTLTSLSAYEQLRRHNEGDYDNGPSNILTGFYIEKPRQFSQEIRVQSKAGQPLTWIVGAYFLGDRLKTNSDLNLLGLFRDPTAPFNGAVPSAFIGDLHFPYTQTTDSAALFGQADYHVNDKLTATLGLRYSHDRVAMNYRSFYLEPQGIIPGYGVTLDDTQSFHDLSYRAALNFKPDEDTLIYASASSGYNAGGFPGGSATTLTELKPYTSEKLYAYELGYKTELFDHRLRLATAAFYYDYKDIQVYILDDTGILPVQRKGNAEGAEIYGFEAELFAKPVQPLEISFGLGFNHGRYRSFIVPPNDFTGNTLTNSPKFTFSGSIQYTHDMGDLGALVGRLDGYAQTKVYYQPANDPLYGQSAIQQLNGQLTYKPAAGRWQAGLWVKNIANQRYTTAIFPIVTSDALGWNDPRTYGVRFGYHF